MPQQSENVQWNGASGKNYTFEAHPIKERPVIAKKGIYIFASAVSGGWEAVLIGRGELTAEIDHRLSEKCVLDHQATHVHVHPREDATDDDRQAIVADLLEAHREAYKPNGCNAELWTPPM
jgi:hypothetical protein